LLSYICLWFHLTGLLSPPGLSANIVVPVSIRLSISIPFRCSIIIEWMLLLHHDVLGLCSSQPSNSQATALRNWSLVGGKTSRLVGERQKKCPAFSIRWTSHEAQTSRSIHCLACRSADVGMCLQARNHQMYFWCMPRAGGRGRIKYRSRISKIN
jgi:hypothetical protein